jgi:hypothetical protein
MKMIKAVADGVCPAQAIAVGDGSLGRVCVWSLFEETIGGEINSEDYLKDV